LTLEFGMVECRSTFGQSPERRPLRMGRAKAARTAAIVTAIAILTAGGDLSG